MVVQISGIQQLLGGNPNLESLKSNNYDLAYENYYAEGSYVAAKYF